ncbi:hypothetical protein [Pseudomonas congelans]|uniref:hypothetical protein n=1 Tax=Pseudomonas congelans TaxID=200452 RepID=UPI0004E29CFB|nr:hypothetical protein [Pseudomonas congelans]KFE46990.1 hypothetical protein IV03_09970 [Pseudomonas congelans]
MQLHEAVEIFSTFSEDMVNENIGIGWTLLAVTSGTYEGERQPCYILGKSAKQIGMIDSVIEVKRQSQ